MKVGFGLMLTSFLFGFLVLLIGNRLSPEILNVVYYVLAGTFLISVILMIRCKFNDPDEIHSFALTDKGELFHISIAIPPHVISMTSFFDPFGTTDQIHKRTTFSDAVRLACDKKFAKRAQEALNRQGETHHLGWMQDNNPYSAATDMVKMKEMTVEKVTLTGAVIRYRTEDYDIIRRARLFRHNAGYKILLNHIKSESGAER
jgi:hypothetical protein